MKLIILRNNLLDGLSSVEKSVGINTNLPILKNIKIEANEKNVITLTSTDLEVAMIHKISGKVIKTGVVLIPFSVFNSLVKNLNSEKINIEKKDKKIIISADNYEASINIDDFNEYPIIPSIKNKQTSLEINKSDFKESLSQVIVATQYSEIRPEINGIYFNYQNNKLVLVGTDSFRLVERLVRPNNIKSNSKELSFVVPLKTVEILLKVLDDEGELEIVIDSTQILFKTAEKQLISRLLDSSFPDYKSIIPKDIPIDVLGERSELIGGVKLTRVFAGKANDITFKINNKKNVMEIFSTNNVVGENTYLLPIKIKGQKKDLSLVFNWKFVLDGLKIFSGRDVIWGITDVDKPVILKSPSDPDLTYVVMPIRS